MRCLVVLSLILGLLLQPVLAEAASFGAPEPVIAPSPDQAAAILGLEGPVAVRRIDAGVPGWEVTLAGRTVGHIASTWEVAGSVGYSGRPLEVLVGITPDARIAGAILVRHNEPVLTLGISDADIAAYVAGFRGYDLSAPPARGLSGAGLPDVISRATVSTGVIRDGILRTARTLAIGRGITAADGGIDRLSFVPTDWPGLLAMGALTETQVTMAEAATALAGAKVPITASDKPFLHLWAGLADPPTVGQSLLGQQDFSRAVGTLGVGETALIVISAGLHSHRGPDWKTSGRFDRVTVVQGETRWQPTAETYQMLKHLRAAGAPEVKEISLFQLPAAFDPTRPLRLEITATRPTVSGEVSMMIPLDYTLPQVFRVAPPPEDEPLWRTIWQAKRGQTAVVAVFLGCLTLILFAQEWITHRPRLWRYGRMGFLATTLVVLGWGLNGQLSVVQVVAFVHSLLTGFRWETFLIEPVIFLLWSFVALGLLFWGRGVYCGWLCPFGALQELTNDAAQRLGVRQIAVPQALHERLWVIKYTLFVGILSLSFYSMHDALVMAEVEPFKTAISLRMIRAWPFLLFVAALLFAGLFIERFYCRYLCPLGAGLAIPAKLKIFDWLKRRPQCGRECRLCETKCTVGAIDPLGRINVNECVLCLRCQVIMNDGAQCPVLKRRARGAEGVSS